MLEHDKNFTRLNPFASVVSITLVAQMDEQG